MPRACVRTYKPLWLTVSPKDAKSDLLQLMLHPHEARMATCLMPEVRERKQATLPPMKPDVENEVSEKRSVNICENASDS